ncbi:glycoside hydrolase family 15 protein [Halobacteriales archaeon Cl-PHB]
MDFRPLEDYGIIGNLETVALVSCDGSVDWCCFPHMDSPSVFGRLLDADAGGWFAVRPARGYETNQRYLGQTNVLQTQFETESGTVVLTDFMPVVQGDEPLMPFEAIYRRVECHEAPVDVEVAFKPRFDYARYRHTLETSEAGVVAWGPDETLSLTADVPFRVADGDAIATVPLEPGETKWFAAAYDHVKLHDPAHFESLLAATADWWHDWVHDCGEIAPCPVDGPWHGLSVRSELVLKLLIQRDTGAIAAAPTTSLPEEIGGVRNWDYRYNWVRDAAFTVQALHKLGHVDEAKRFFRWMLGLCTHDPASIQPLYGLHGETGLTEETLDHLEGYRYSAPVRVGNDAADQRQLDVYGELILGIHETALFGEYISPAEWETMKRIVDYVCDVWEEPDAGIWEVRSEPRQFTYSKVMCWAALDRAIDIAAETAFEGPIDRWRAERDRIRRTILDRGYDEERETFVRSFGSDNLDATSLLIPMVGFLPFDDDRVRGTIQTTVDDLTTEEGLVYRYFGDDGLPGREGAFLLCSFWLVDALALSGCVQEARTLLERLRQFVSPLGLLAEEVHPTSGELLGNFPQAYSHIGLLNSAIYLNRMERRKQRGPEPMGCALTDEFPPARTPSIDLDDTEPLHPAE